MSVLVILGIETQMCCLFEHTQVHAYCELPLITYKFKITNVYSLTLDVDLVSIVFL